MQQAEWCSSPSTMHHLVRCRARAVQGLRHCCTGFSWEKEGDYSQNPRGALLLLPNSSPRYASLCHAVLHSSCGQAGTAQGIFPHCCKDSQYGGSQSPLLVGDLDRCLACPNLIMLLDQTHSSIACCFLSYPRVVFSKWHCCRS